MLQELLLALREEFLKLVLRMAGLDFFLSGSYSLGPACPSQRLAKWIGLLLGYTAMEVSLDKVTALGSRERLRGEGIGVGGLSLAGWQKWVERGR